MSIWLLVAIYVGLGVVIVFGDLCRRAFKKDSELEKIGAWDSIGLILDLPFYVICWPAIPVLVWLARRQNKAAPAATQLKDAQSSKLLI